jgi:S-formylglutathione hydrolase FrmB
MKPLLLATLALTPITLFAEGTVVSGTLESSALGVTKSYNVYLPTGYEAAELRYPVIYLLHGWGVTEDSWSSPPLDVQKIADAMNLQALIVMPDADRGVFVNALTPPDYAACMTAAPPVRNAREPRDEYCVRSGNYEDYLLAEIIPHVDARYRTVATREGRAIIGESAGGLASMHLALRHKDLFASAGSHAGLLDMLYQPWDDTVVTAIAHRDGFEEWEAMFGMDIAAWKQYDPRSLLDSLRPGELALYLDVGTDDEVGAYQQNLRFQQRLQELGLAHTFVPVSGGHHDDAFFGSRIPFNLEFQVQQFQNAGLYTAAQQPARIVSPLANQAAIRGCAWTASAPALGPGYVFLAERDDSEILMNVDGVDVQFELTGANGSLVQVGDVMDKWYRATGVDVLARYAATQVCPADAEGCENTRFGATFIVRQGARIQTVSATGEVGC